MSKTLEFGQDLPSSGNTFLRVKQKGDKIQFRIAQNPTYVGKHFIQKEEGWDVPLCVRINDNEECSYCEQYFKLMKEAKKFADDKAKSDKLKKEARHYNCSITFYFPVLDRDTQEFGILQTTYGVRNKINEFYENGTDVLSKDFILRNTGSESPKDRYSLTIVDSTDTKPFTEKETANYELAKNYDLSEIRENHNSEE